MHITSTFLTIFSSLCASDLFISAHSSPPGTLSSEHSNGNQSPMVTEIHNKSGGTCSTQGRDEVSDDLIADISNSATSLKVKHI